jgi:hypothetical protein
MVSAVSAVGGSGIEWFVVDCRGASSSLMQEIASGCVSLIEL